MSSEKTEPPTDWGYLKARQRALHRRQWIADHREHGTVTEHDRYDECSCGKIRSRDDE